MSRDEVSKIIGLLDLERPKAFNSNAKIPTESEFFEECTLGILTSRQSTNFRGHRQVTLGPNDTQELASLLRELRGLDALVLDQATHAQIVLTRPYRTVFTLLLTFIGHKPITSLLTVAIRALRKKFQHRDDIPSIGFLQHIHVGILADGIERAAIIASEGKRCANVILAPFCGKHRAKNRATIRKLHAMIRLSTTDRAAGWRIGLVAQVGEPGGYSQFEHIPSKMFRKLGANLVAFRSERIQPGVNQDDKASPQYGNRQDMDVPEDLIVMSERAAYNAFVHWTGCSRAQAKNLLLLERIDVSTSLGNQRLRNIREMLGFVTERVIATIPLWADLATGKALSRNAARGKKAFVLAGQRIYVGGLDRCDIEECGLDWELALRAFGAAAARSALLVEIMGVVDLPSDCDLLAGISLMAGPVNQNDIGKSFYGQEDILKSAFPDKDPTSLLVWTLKAKTIADPIGNEEQLMSHDHKGALVDLRPAPHEVVFVKTKHGVHPFRKRGSKTSNERAFYDVGNFVSSPDSGRIPGNEGQAWDDDRLFE